MPDPAALWRARIPLVLERANSDPARLRRMGWERFAGAVRRQLPRWGTTRWYSAIVRAVFDALGDRPGVAVQRRGALERAHLVLEDWRAAHRRLAEVEARMAGILDELDLTELVTSIPGLSAVGAAQILAECGNPSQFASPRSLVKHAGLCPARTTVATTPGCHGCRDEDAPACAWPPGRPCGAPCTPTPSTRRASCTSPPEQPIR